MAETHIHRIRNSSNKAARLARVVIDLKTITSDDIEAGLLKDGGVRSAVLRSCLVKPTDRVVKPKIGEQKTAKPVGSPRWDTASEEIWAQVEIIAIAFLEDV